MLDVLHGTRYFIPLRYGVPRPFEKHINIMPAWIIIWLAEPKKFIVFKNVNRKYLVFAVFFFARK